MPRLCVYYVEMLLYGLAQCVPLTAFITGWITLGYRGCRRPPTCWQIVTGRAVTATSLCAVELPPPDHCPASCEMSTTRIPEDLYLNFALLRGALVDFYTLCVAMLYPCILGQNCRQANREGTALSQLTTGRNVTAVLGDNPCGNRQAKTCSICSESPGSAASIKTCENVR